jgi:hypothetical protein
MAKPLRKPMPSILTLAQREEYADELAAGVPEAVIKEFADRLDAAERRWTRELRRALRTGTRAILR